MTDRQAYFETLYDQRSDPYGTRTRWYEQRKRAVLLAALPQQRYIHGFEPGCGAGELTLELSKRCDALLASDFSAPALAAARQRTKGLHNVTIEQQALPHDWPHDVGHFDLIVVSELGYFLEPAAMQQLAGSCALSLTPEGTLVACDWRPDFDARALATDAVHAAFEDRGLTRLLRHEEDDFLLQVWSGDPRSVAQREGIR